MDENERTVRVSAGRVTLEGNLTIPEAARGIVVFAHGSGSSRHSPRNRFVAGAMQAAGFATLLFDLLTVHEENYDTFTARLRFDIGLLAARLVGATDWLASRVETAQLGVGYFGSSTGAAAALVAATRRPDAVRTIVSRGGRPDLAGPALSLVRVPTLLIVGGDDLAVIDVNQEAMRRMRAPVELEIIPGATHLFEEPGTLEEVARYAATWFQHHLTPTAEIRPTHG
jgi:pimeloyl-ACP methyl ester carboxylesterase